MEYIMYAVLITIHKLQEQTLHPPLSLSGLVLTLSLSALPSAVRHSHSFCSSTLTAEAAHTHKHKNTYECRVTQDIARQTKTHNAQTNSEQRKWLTMPQNACAYAHVHTLIYLLNTLLWYPFSSSVMCMCVWVCVYISVNVRVRMVTLEKRHCESTEG